MKKSSFTNFAETSVDDLINPVPARIYRDGGEIFVEWVDMADKRFTEPFFESTVRVQKLAKKARTEKTRLDFLRQIENPSPPVVKLSGLIFHSSRCGSTLVSQMLAAAAQNIVVSESPPLDFVIGNRVNPKLSEPEQIEYLRKIANILGRKRYPEENQMTVKLDSWHILNADVILKAFPGAPCVFLYRNPVEVIVSHLRLPGMQMMPGVIGNLLPAFELPELLQMNRAEYIARVLGRICESALKLAADSKLLLINYNQLPEACFSKLLPHFNIECHPSDVEKMKNAARFDAKSPQTIFSADSENKKREAGETIERYAARFVQPFYERLEEIRMRSNS